MILVAPTSFKGTLSNGAVARAVADAVAGFGHEIVVRPLSDGGPGLIESLQSVQPGRGHRVAVRGPYNENVIARVFEQNARVVIESADACGIHLTTHRTPLTASTYGVGQLINEAAKFGKPIVIGLGGSATVDGGAGMREALHELDALDAELPAMTALCDVRTTLFDAARIFGPQKGASPADVEILESRLQQLAAGHDDVAGMEGSGAAGGLGFGLGLAGAELLRGSDWVMRELGIDDLLAQVDLVITGEGAFDAQSSMGKITGELIGRARCPVILIAGSVEGQLPPHVRAIAGGENLSLDDVARLASGALSA